MPHTPGPWQAKLGRSMAFDVSIVNSEGFIVARTSESNGPLIAAAPDLFARLDEMARTVELIHGMHPETANIGTLALAVARLALDKAAVKVSA